MRPFARAYTGTIENVGAACASTPFGCANARTAQSSTSSDPHPVTISSGRTPAYSASGAFSSALYRAG
nr:hypothetical protein [Gemmatirosa kalamazoonensis]